MDKGLRSLRGFVLCYLFFTITSKWTIGMWEEAFQNTNSILGYNNVDHYWGAQRWLWDLGLGSWNHKANFVKTGAKFGLPWLPSGKEFCLTVKGTQVQPLIQDDSTCHGATKPVHHNHWACALEPMGHSSWRPCTWGRRSATGEVTRGRSPRTATRE